MHDKADIVIPFDDLNVCEFNSCFHPDNRAGSVDVSHYDYKCISLVEFIDGEVVYSKPQSVQWSSISSAVSQMAVAFYPEGNGFDEWPHVRIKASPSKILQGHNVYGSESLKQGVMQMLTLLGQAYPKIYAHLDIKGAEIRYLDTTYSAKLKSRFFVAQLFKFLDKICLDKQKVSRNREYIQFGAGSRYQRQKFYMKDQELKADADKAKKQRNKEKYNILSDVELNKFAKNRIRLEATTGNEKLKALGIPTNLIEFLRFESWFLKTHKTPVTRHIWNEAFKSIFEKLKGHTMKNVDDDKIREAIYYKFSDSTKKQPNRLPNSIWATYQDLKREGYRELIKHRSSTFYRNVKNLQEIGLSKAFIMSLESDNNNNIVPLVQLIEIDFSIQRPSSFVEPIASYNNPLFSLKQQPQLRLVS